MRSIFFAFFIASTVIGKTIPPVVAIHPVVDEMYFDYLFGNEKPIDNEWITKHAIIGVPVPVENKTIAAGEDLILHCEIGGIPTPAVIWARNGEYLFSGKGSFINWEEKNLNQGREPTETGIMAVELIIPCAQPSDSGVYSCLGNNLHHRIESTSHVVVEGPPKECPPKAPAAPKIVAWTESRAENQGLTATLVCISDIPAQWTWSFEGREIIEQIGRYEIKEHGNLMIHNLLFSHLGTYYCTASNEFGNSTAETYLHVTRSHS
ncbi:hypothetical protein L3Y34_012832 [Caenorhabditis briggsae]|uniref:Ig-like domain-containing protein n=2 Tax=Caenorhabditis briggsae TaxID=6238 RepID=A0AAE8ZZP2_CAEBR|nr:hypothetical protein L3Y34_012832 [Caenorhabditis briggsae]